MAITESARHQLFNRFEEVLGAVPTATLKDLLPPVGWDKVATKHDLAELEKRLDLRFDALAGSFATGLAESAHRQTRVFVGWMLGGLGTTSGAMVGVVALFT